MFEYYITKGQVLIPVDDFSKVKKTAEVLDAGKVKVHLEYPNGIIMDSVLTSDGATITINRELIENPDGNYELKEKI